MEESLFDIYRKLAILYTITGKDWDMRIHVNLTEPTCPSVIIYEEDKPSLRYRFDRPTIEEGVRAAVDAVYREMVLNEKVEPECPLYLEEKDK